MRTTLHYAAIRRLFSREGAAKKTHHDAMEPLAQPKFCVLCAPFSVSFVVKKNARIHTYQRIQFNDSTIKLLVYLTGRHVRYLPLAACDTVTDREQDVTIITSNTRAIMLFINGSLV
jgi:hypothetical protein